MHNYENRLNNYKKAQVFGMGGLFGCLIMFIILFTYLEPLLWSAAYIQTSIIISDVKYNWSYNCNIVNSTVINIADYAIFQKTNCNDIHLVSNKSSLTNISFECVTSLPTSLNQANLYITNCLDAFILDNDNNLIEKYNWCYNMYINTSYTLDKSYCYKIMKLLYTIGYKQNDEIYHNIDDTIYREILDFRQNQTLKNINDKISPYTTLYYNPIYYTSLCMHETESCRNYWKPFIYDYNPFPTNSEVNQFNYYLGGTSAVAFVSVLAIIIGCCKQSCLRQINLVTNTSVELDDITHVDSVPNDYHDDDSDEDQI